MTRDDVVTAARACLHTPFHHQGRAPGVGLDCAGLIVAVCQALGIAHSDLPGYGRRPDSGRLESHLAAQAALRRIHIHEIGPSDLLLMRFRRDPQHLAIVTDAGIIHSHEDAGGVVEHRLDSVWRARIVAAYRFREIIA